MILIYKLRLVLVLEQKNSLGLGSCGSEKSISNKNIRQFP